MTRNLDIRLSVFFAVLGLIAWGCGEKTATPTSGQVTVSVSEEVLPLIREEESVFEELYPDATVDLHPMSSREAIAGLFDDSVKVIVSARPLNEEERAAQRTMDLEIYESQVATDAIAVIVNISNDVTKLRLSQLDSIFSGSIRDWGLVGWSGAKGKISICLPDRNMASYEVFTSKVLDGRGFGEPDSIIGSSPGMIDAVRNNSLAIGFVGINWMRENQDRVRILELTNPHAPDSLGIAGKYIYPHPAYIFKEFYPIVRDIYIYSTPDSYGVSSGFISFITSAAGQKIVLNQGLVPATMPVRLVELKNENL